MKFGSLSALAIASVLLGQALALAGPVNPPKPQIEPQALQIEQARYHRQHLQRHHPWGHHRRHAARAGGGGDFDPAFANLFWPLAGGDCMFYGCGWSYGYNPDCYFYSCAYGWNMGPFAWGLYGPGLL